MLQEEVQPPPIPPSSSSYSLSSSPPILETETQIQEPQQSQTQTQVPIQVQSQQPPLSVPLLGEVDEIASLAQSVELPNRSNRVAEEDEEEVTLRNLWNDLIEYSEGDDDSYLRVCCWECDCCGSLLFPICCPIWIAYSICCFPLFCLFNCRCRKTGPWSQVCCCWCCCSPSTARGRGRGRGRGRNEGKRTALLTGENLHHP